MGACAGGAVAVTRGIAFPPDMVSIERRDMSTRTSRCVAFQTSLIIDHAVADGRDNDDKCFYESCFATDAITFKHPLGTVTIIPPISVGSVILLITSTSAVIAFSQDGDRT